MTRPLAAPSSSARPTSARTTPANGRCTEHGIPNGADDRGPAFEKWFIVSDKLGTHFCEHINGAVIAVWPT